MSGEARGVGGVVEMLKAKYGCARGQRLRVIGETSALLQFEGGKTVPKNHEGSGFRWVFREEEEAKLAKQAKDEAARQAQAEEAKKAEAARKAKREAEKERAKEE